MKMLEISRAMAPALGDIRELGDGDWVYIHPDSADRPDWPRYWEAAGVAFVRGARLIHLVD